MIPSIQWSWASCLSLSPLHNHFFLLHLGKVVFWGTVLRLLLSHCFYDNSIRVDKIGHCFSHAVFDLLERVHRYHKLSQAGYVHGHGYYHIFTTYAIGCRLGNRKSSSNIIGFVSTTLPQFHGFDLVDFGSLHPTIKSWIWYRNPRCCNQFR